MSRCEGERSCELEQLQVAHDVGEGSVQLVGDAGRHLADGRQLLRLQQLLLGLLQLLDRVLLALEELGVLDGERGVAGERLGRAQGVPAEGLRGARVVHVEHPQGAREGAPSRRPRSGGSAGEGTRRSGGAAVSSSTRPVGSRSRPPRPSSADGRDHLARLEGPPHDRARDPVPVDARPRPGARGRRAAAARPPRGSARRGRAVGEQEEAPLGAGDVHDRVEHLLEDLAQHQRRVQGLDEGEQELLLLDPGQLGHRAGRALRPEQRELQRHVAELDLRSRARAPPGAPWWRSRRRRAGCPRPRRRSARPGSRSGRAASRSRAR